MHRLWLIAVLVIVGTTTRAEAQQLPPVGQQTKQNPSVPCSYYEQKAVETRQTAAGEEAKARSAPPTFAPGHRNAAAAMRKVAAAFDAEAAFCKKHRGAAAAGANGGAAAGATTPSPPSSTVVEDLGVITAKSVEDLEAAAEGTDKTRYHGTGTGAHRPKSGGTSLEDFEDNEEEQRLGNGERTDSENLHNGVGTKVIVFPKPGDPDPNTSGNPNTIVFGGPESPAMQGDGEAGGASSTTGSGDLEERIRKFEEDFQKTFGPAGGAPYPSRLQGLPGYAPPAGVSSSGGISHSGSSDTQQPPSHPVDDSVGSDPFDVKRATNAVAPATKNPAETKELGTLLNECAARPGQAVANQVGDLTTDQTPQIEEALNRCGTFAKVTVARKVAKISQYPVVACALAPRECIQSMVKGSRAPEDPERRP